MGNGYHSKIAAPCLPARPFDPSNQSCLKQNFGYKKLQKPELYSSLSALILRQDWQRVLIRASLFPNELRLSFDIHIYGITLTLLPLHLVCALDPPVAVVDTLLKHFVDASALMIQPAPLRFDETHIETKRMNRLKKFRQHMRRWTENRNGSFPVTDVQIYSAIRQVALRERDQDSTSAQQTESLLPKQDIQPCSTIGPESFYQGSMDYSEFAEENMDNESVMDSSTSSSPRDEVSDNGTTVVSGVNSPVVLLQLSEAGGLTAVTLKSSGEIKSLPSEASAKNDNDEGLFRVHWDMYPLLQEVVVNGALLPIHIACIYNASAEVVESLLRAYPLGASSLVLGMLPIHLVCAGWNLPIISERSNSFDEITVLPEKKPGPLSTLKVLYGTSVDSVNVRSKNHSMTPEEYLEECMEDGEYKEACQKVVAGMQSGDDMTLDVSESESDEVGLPHISSEESLMFVGCSHDSSVSPLAYDQSESNCMALVVDLSEVIAEQKWEEAVELVEDDPSLACRWCYEFSDDAVDAVVVSKRLPLHLACLYNAPFGLIEVLIRSFPRGATMVDYPDGSQPLHIVCDCTETDLATFKLVFASCPESVKAVDRFGRLPLHRAILSKASWEVVQYLVRMHPESVTTCDEAGRRPVDYALDEDHADAEVTDLMTTILSLLVNCPL